VDKSKDRKWRLEQLLNQQKMKQSKNYGLLFSECADALGVETVIFSKEKSKQIYDSLQQSYPFSPWSRIDWLKVTSKVVVANTTEIRPLLTKLFGSFEVDVHILWSYGDFPVLQSTLDKVISAIDDVLAVSADTFIFSPSRFVLEFHHDGEITIGFESKPHSLN
jgi:hypothetical protein